MVLIVIGALGFVLGTCAAGIVWTLPRSVVAAPQLDAPTIATALRGHVRVRAWLQGRANPETITGLLLTIAVAIFVLGVVGSGVLLMFIDHNAMLARWDLAAARFGADHATNSDARWMRIISLVGGTPFMIVAGMSSLVWMGIKRRKPGATAAFLMTVIVGQLIIVNLTKVVVGRERPNIRRLTGFSGYSFPSGHAATAAVTCAAVALLLGRGVPRRRQVLLVGLSVGVTSSVAMTRIFLGVHWMSDVVAGVAIGWSWFALTSIAFGGRLLQFGQPIKTAERIADAMPPETVDTISGTRRPA